MRIEVQIPASKLVPGDWIACSTGKVGCLWRQVTGAPRKHAYAKLVEVPCNGGAVLIPDGYATVQILGD